MRQISGRPQGALVRAAWRLNTSAALLLAALLVAMVNYLSWRHYARFDWTATRRHTLSEKTRQILNAVTTSVQVIVFLQPSHELFEDVVFLLKEYEAACPLLRVERVDPDRDLARAEQLMRQYDIKESNVIVFEANDRRKYVRLSELAEYDYSVVLEGERPRRKAFKGEQAFSAAIHSLLHARRPVVYFLQGHGERDPESFDRGRGYATAAEMIRRENAEVKTLRLGEVREIPEDAAAVVIAGPQRPYSAAEVDVLKNYLEEQGRLLLLLDADTTTGLELLLESWGVRLGADVVLDPGRSLTGAELFISAYGEHPITRPLQGLSCVFFMPRSVEPFDSQDGERPLADGTTFARLALCSEEGWAETDLAQSPMRYDPGKDLPGPVSIALAIEKGPAAGLDVKIRPARMVVVGDSDFAADGLMTGANRDFLLGAVNWLLEREELIAIAPRVESEADLLLSGPQLRMLFWGVMAVLPALPAAVGLVVWYRRRR